MKFLLHKLVSRAIDWFFRRRAPGMFLIKGSLWLLAVLLGAGWATEIIVPTSSGPLRFSFNWNQGAPFYLLLFGLVVAIICFVVGIVLLVRDELRLSKKRAIAIELRGLRDTTGSALKDRIPTDMPGRREQILINIRRVDGRIQDPEEALQQVVLLPMHVANCEAGVDRSDIAMFAGGLAPVPFSFLMGLLLDDEGRVTLMDWDRSIDDWRSLDGEDDGDRFTIEGMDKVGQAVEIVLSISVSYPTDIAGIDQKFPGQPVILLTLPKLTSSGEWSDTKQIALAQDFFHVLRVLTGTKVKRINLVLAAPNSVVIRFGRIYDKRNLPPIIVWQYESGQIPRYPWGVSMPIAGNKAEIIR